jgi:hypothetical protein
MAKVAAVMAEILAIEANVATVMAEVLPVVANFYAIVTDVTIKTGPALGLCGNGEEYTGGEENSQFRFHDLKF